MSWCWEYSSRLKPSETVGQAHYHHRMAGPDGDRLTLQRTYNLVGTVARVNSSIFRFDR